MISRDPADVIEQLHRLRDFARRICDPHDLGKHAHRDIRRAAHQALAGEDPTPSHQETRCRTNPRTMR